jgi:hypothetical protein
MAFRSRESARPLDFVQVNEVAVGHIAGVIVVDRLLRRRDQPFGEIHQAVFVSQVVVHRVFLATRHAPQLLRMMTLQLGLSRPMAPGCTALGVNRVFHVGLIISGTVNPGCRAV